MKVLKAQKPEKCNGCELCVMECQRQLRIVGLEGSLIRILKGRNSETKLKFIPNLDPRLPRLDQEKIASICPNGVFEFMEEINGGFIS